MRSEVLIKGIKEANTCDPNSQNNEIKSQDNMIQDKSLTFSSQIDNSKDEILGHILYSKSKSKT